MTVLIEANIFEALDEDWAIECEHRGHDGTFSRTESERAHGGPAKYWVSGPCSQANGFRCAVFYEWTQQQITLKPRYLCLYCGNTHSWAESIFTPIGGAS